MSSFENRMIEAIERGDATEDTAYDYVRDSLADLADRRRDEQRLGETRDEVVGPRGRPHGTPPLPTTSSTEDDPV